MIDSLVRDFQNLRRADLLIGKIWAQVLARRIGFFLVAGLIAAFGIGMANLAGLYALQPLVGPAWAACVIAAADLLLAAIVVILARTSKPGPEIELAFDIRKMALDALATDARGLTTAVDKVAQEAREAKQAFVGAVHHPLDTAIEKLLIPGAIAAVRGLRARNQTD